MIMLEIKDLYKDFNGMQILSGVNLQIKKGEKHAIIGPNGAGKTTLFNVITGTYKPSKGHILFRSEDISGFKPHQICNLGIGRSFQITSTFSGLTAFQNIRLAVLARRGIHYNLFRMVNNMKEITQETEEILENINMIGSRNIPAGSLSYGQQRSLEIGLAFASDPDLAFLDEFAAGMSRDETHSAVELIRKLAVSKTIVMIEHDMDVVFNLADRITVLYYGRILTTGTPQEIRLNRDVKDAYLGDLEV